MTVGGEWWAVGGGGCWCYQLPRLLSGDSGLFAKLWEEECGKWKEAHSIAKLFSSSRALGGEGVWQSVVDRWLVSE